MTWLKVMDHISIIFIEQDVYLLFSPVWKYCFVTQERINSSFCTERGIIGHLGAHWEERQKCIWDCCLQWFQFYRDGYGWLAQGERSSLENKGRLTFMAAKKKKKRKRAIEARYERVFICLSGWKFTIFLFSFHLSLPTSHCIIPPPTLLSFLITLSHEAPLPPRRNIPPTGDSQGFTWAQTGTGTNTPHIIPPSSLVVSVSKPPFSLSLSEPLPLLVFCCCFFCMSLVFHTLSSWPLIF